ncbi:MAG: SprT family zinc-dependent metalloprotease [Spiroplasma sp.]|nr:SprT family zinc-dependent metalloprotease [Spiroplasma sp.]
MEVKTIFFQDQTWQYFINYRQQKHLYLKLKGEQIIVSAPFFVKLPTIEEFVKKNLPKLIKQLKDNAAIVVRFSFNPEAFIYFLDQKLPIIVNYQPRTKFFIGDESFFIYTSLSLNNKNHQAILLPKINQFLKNLARPILLERLKYWQKIIKVTANSFDLRLMKTKWGVCFHETGKIVFNIKLIHFSYQVIDYVVIHELVHLIYPHHQKDFWNLVALYCPDYRNYKKILKNSKVEL